MKRWFKRKSKAAPVAKKNDAQIKPPKEAPPPPPKEKNEAEPIGAPGEVNDGIEAKENIDQEKEKILNQANVKKRWKLEDAVAIYSNSMKQYCPGVVVEIDEEKKEMTVRYWLVQSMELKYKVRGLFDSKGIKRRKYATKYDPWNMPFEAKHLSNEYYDIVKEELFKKHSELLSELLLDTIDYNQRFELFKIFLSDSKKLCQKNPFIRLIGSYLGEKVESWIDIFVRFIFTMTIFEQESKDKKHFDTKMDILFNILNVGSVNIDTEALNIICIMYIKCTLSKKYDEKIQTKKQIADFAKRLLEKITAEDNEIDIDEFKQLIGENDEMIHIISGPVDQILRSDVTLR